MKFNEAGERVFYRDLVKPALVDCRNRQPLEDEEIHEDLRRDLGAEKMLASLAWMVEGVVELASPNCPDDLTQTKYFKAWQRVHHVPAFLEHWTKAKQSMLRECVLTGYEMVGWPVVYRHEDGLIRCMDGAHRLALKLGQGVPIRAVVQGERAKQVHS